jgi:hypothetical protein
MYFILCRHNIPDEYTYLHSLYSYCEVFQTKPVCSDTNAFKVSLVILPITVPELALRALPLQASDETHSQKLQNTTEFVTVLVKD